MTNIEKIRSQLSELHDAVLLSVAMKWEDGAVSISCRGSKGAVALVVSHVSRLECPREFPWGPSVSINAARLTSLPNGTIRLEVEMQSGDVVIVQGDSMSVSE